MGQPARQSFLSASARAWRTLSRDRFALAGGLGVLFFVGVAVLAPLVAPYCKDSPASDP